MADPAADDEWLSRGSIEVQEVGRHYDEWAETYDHDIRSWQYNAPEVVAEQVIAQRADARSLLDAGCGTGLVGAALSALGFAGEIHGIDLSPASLPIAERTGAYTALGWADLQRPLEIGDDSFDVVVCVGVMTYVPDVEAACREFTRVTRSGGLMIVTQRDDLWIPRSCQAIVDRLVAEGLWTRVEVTDPQRYLPDNPEAIGSVPVRYVTAHVS